jgi:Uma2 family endonuclease
MDISRIRMTNEQYMAMPDDGKRYELHDGILVEQRYTLPNGDEMPSAIFIHNWIVSVLQYALMQVVFKQQLGYVLGDGQDYILGKGVILKPDVSFIAGRFETPPKYPTTSPDIAVEILSPSNTASEMNYKINAYLQYGSRLVWVIDPEKQSAAVYRKGEGSSIVSIYLTAEDTLTGGDVLPDFRLPLNDLFGSIPSEA